MFYDLNVPWNSNTSELKQRIAFLTELGYNALALSHILPTATPAKLTSPIPEPLPFPVPPKVRILTRVTIPLANTANSPRLADIRPHYDIIAVRPIDEKGLAQASQSLDADIISLDLSIRYPFHFKYGMFANAIERGIKLEICYSPGILSDAESRRNLIQNATALIRTVRGRAILISSEAANALGCRAPRDVVNLATVWGLSQERGMEAVDENGRSVVASAELRKRGYRGAVDVVHGGDKQTVVEDNAVSSKRKADSNQEESEKPVSKNEMRRRAKKARLEEQEKKASEAASGT